MAVWGGLAVLFAGAAWLEYVMLDRSVGLLLDERVRLAEVAAFHLSEDLAESLRVVQGEAASLTATHAAGKRDRARESISRFRAAHNEFSRLLLTDERGIIAVESGSGSSRVGLSLAHIPQMKQALSSDQPVIVFQKKGPLFIQDEIVFFVPLVSASGPRVGVLGAEMDANRPPFDPMIEDLKVNTRGGTVEVINETGIVVGGTDADERFAPFEHWLDIQEQIQAGRPFHILSQAGQETTPAALAMAPLRAAPWWVNVEQPVPDLLAPVRQLQRWFWLAFAIALLLSTVFAYFSTGWVLGPIQAIVKVARRMEAGDVSTPFPPQQGAEMGTLSRQLEAARQRLSRWTHELEERVAARTRALADEVAERKRAEEELLKRHRELSVLYAIDRAIAQSLDLSTILNLALKATLDALKMDTGVILLLEPDGETLKLRASLNVPPELAEAIPPDRPGRGPVGRAFEQGKPDIVRIQDLPAGAMVETMSRLKVQIFAATPLISGGQKLGGLALGSRMDRAFPPEEIELLTSVGQQIGAAVQNARLYETVRRELAERRRAEERYRDLFENMPLGAYRTTPDGRIIVANPALIRMLGYDSFDDLARQNLEASGFHPEYPRQQFKDLLERDGEVRGLEAAWIRKDGTTIHLRESARVVRGPTGETAFYEGSVEDITERKKLEEQLRQSQKIEAVGELAGGVAHDFNNLLNVITGFTELAKDALPPGHAAVDSLNKVNTAAFRAADLTRKLLAFSRRQILQMDLVNLNDVVDDFSKMLSRIVGEDIEVRIVKVPALLLAKADIGQLEQVLLNLCTNARQAMPKGGELLIETRAMTLDDEFVAAHPWARTGRFVELSVTDTGVGMTPEVRSRIFEPFFTTRPEGTGLGLAMVYGIVKQHDGFVSVYSEPGRGTSFHVYIPMAEGVAQRTAPEAPLPAIQGTETLLIAEDEPLLRELVVASLSGLGYNVLTAVDGEDALQQFSAHRDAIALVILDAVMPKLTGHEAYLRMAAIHPGLKAIFTSGYAPDSMHVNYVLRQGLTLIQKPYSPKTLAAKIRELLDSPAAPPSTA